MTLPGTHKGERMKENEYKKVDADTVFYITADCPYCEAYLTVTDDMREHLTDGLSAEDCDQEVDCEHCKRTFIIDNIIW